VSLALASQGQGKEAKAMDTTLTTSHRQVTHHRLRVWHTALSLVELVHRQPLGHAELRDQAQRASISSALNLAEGAAHDGAAKKRHYRLARGSAIEVVAAYELGAAIGEKVPVDAVMALGGEIAAVLTKLVR